MPTIINKKDSLPKEDSSNQEQSRGIFSRREEKPENKHYKEEVPRWKLDEIVLNPMVRDTLEDVIVFCKNKDVFIEKWGLDKFLKGTASIGINLYGDPGTGKSISAEAIANALGKNIIMADYSELIDSKWGNTEKFLTALFKQAEESGSVIFIDEADGLLGKRANTDSNSAAMNDVKSHLLKLVDRSNVIVIYATNLFENFDRAFFRRILYHIKYPLPSTEELVELWKMHIGDENIPKCDDDFSYESIAELSQGLSGGDIKNITLKLCVKLAADKIPYLSNTSIKQEVGKYKESLEDSKGLLKGRKLTESEKEELKKDDPETYNKVK